MMAIHAHNVLINDTWTAESNQRHWTSSSGAGKVRSPVASGKRPTVIALHWSCTHCGEPSTNEQTAMWGGNWNTFRLGHVISTHPDCGQGERGRSLAQPSLPWGFSLFLYVSPRHSPKPNRFIRGFNSNRYFNSIESTVCLSVCLSVRRKSVVGCSGNSLIKTVQLGHNQDFNSNPVICIQINKNSSVPDDPTRFLRP